MWFLFHELHNRDGKSTKYINTGKGFDIKHNSNLSNNGFTLTFMSTVVGILLQSESGLNKEIENPQILSGK